MENVLNGFTEDELINLIQSKSPEEVVVLPESLLYKIGVTSFDIITVICEIEDKHNVKIEMEPGFEIETVQQLYDYICCHSQPN